MGAALLVGAVALTGCSSDPSDQPATLPPLPSSTAPTAASASPGSPTASPTPSTTPVAKPRVPSGLNAAQLKVVADVTSYIAAISRAESTGNLGDVYEHMTVECPCRRAIARIPGEWAGDAHVVTRSDYGRIISFGTPRISAAGSAAKVRIVVDIAAEDLFNQSGKKSHHYNAATIGQDLTLEASPRGWKVAKVTDFPV